ncbi:MAG: hypothetical protein R6U63_11065 [Longimicrobiales bacterium]
MSVEIVEVSDRRTLKRWLSFQYDLYADDPLFVPQLMGDELDTMDPAKNPVFDVARARLLLAVEDGQSVGRVCGIIHGLETEKLGRKRGRFGWFECVDSAVVAEAMLAELEAWFRADGCAEMAGPLGFTDLDPEGLLIDGFDALPTIAGSYGKPYYPALLEGYGLTKEVDYQEFRIAIPPVDHPVVQTLRKKAARDQEKYGLRPLKLAHRKELLAYVPQFWEVMERSFVQLYGVTPLTQAQVDYYTKKYFGYIDPDFVQFVVDPGDRLVGFYVGIPSLSRAFQKAGGHLFPTGFWHVLRAFKSEDTVDFLLAGVDPDWSPSKVLPTLAVEMHRALVDRGVACAETNHELETNTTVTGIWSKFEVMNTRRSRVHGKAL